MNKIFGLFCLAFLAWLTFTPFLGNELSKKGLLPEEKEEAVKTLAYFNNLVAFYDECNFTQPKVTPVVKRVKRDAISTYCPTDAIACYVFRSNTIYYPEGDIESFGHEWGHAILYQGNYNFSCWHELILQQRDFYRYFYGDDIVDHRNPRHPKAR